MKSNDQPLHVAYLLEDTDLSGGVRVQVAQADALIARGHEVMIVTKGPPLRWRRSRAEWRHVDSFEEVDYSDCDFVVGGFWTTLEPAYRLASSRALHLCQGYEGSFTAYRDIKDQIDAAYRLPIPTLTVSPHLVPICQSFGSEAVWIGQIVDEEFYREDPPREHEPLRVLLAGPSQIDTKGISDGYGAAAHARSYGAQFDLVRVSPWAPAGDEPARELAAEFHVAVPTEQMVRVVQSCDIILASPLPEEGFGLPAAEAMASGLAAVLTRIPSFLAFDGTHDFALFAEPGDAAELGDQLLELLQDEELRQRVKTRGRAVVEQFRADHTAERMERYLLGRRRQLAART